MHVLQLMASPFVGGPERQVLGLARELAHPSEPGLPAIRTTFASFAERGLARPLLEQASQKGFAAHELRSNYPRIETAAREIAGLIRDLRVDVLCCNGYKPDLIGWRAARRAGIPVIAIAHGWTGVTFKVRLNELLDALVMRWHDAVVCVSQAMQQRVRHWGVPAKRVVLIRNALDARPYERSRPECRANVESFFVPPGRFRLLVGAAGRLSPEKGFDIFLEAAALVCRQRDDVGFLLLGEGKQRAALEQRRAELGLQDRFVLGGFRTDLDRLLPGLDLAVLSSYTEGLPVAVLEAQAAGLPVVATAVGGTPEVVQDGETGYLVPPGQPVALAQKILDTLADEALRNRLGQAGRLRVRREFTFAAQASRYRELFARVCQSSTHSLGVL